MNRPVTCRGVAHTQSPSSTAGALSFLSPVPYLLNDCICQYDCVHAESLHPHFQLLPVHEQM
jgi:hypothetical protein